MELKICIFALRNARIKIVLSYLNRVHSFQFYFSQISQSLFSQSTPKLLKPSSSEFPRSYISLTFSLYLVDFEFVYLKRLVADTKYANFFGPLLLSTRFFFQIFSLASCFEIYVPHLRNENNIYTRLATNLISIDYKSTLQES